MNRKTVVNLFGATLGIGLLVVFAVVLSGWFRTMRAAREGTPVSRQSQPLTTSPKDQEQISPSPTTPESPEQADRTADWKVYVDPVYGYSIRYPPGWYVYPTPQKGLGGVAQIYSYDREQLPARGGVVPSDEIKIEFVVLDNPAKLNAEQWLLQTPEEYRGYTVKSQQVVTIDGVLGLRVEKNKDIYSGIVVLLPKGARIYRVVASPADTRYVDLFNAMLDTFKFPK